MVASVLLALVAVTDRLAELGTWLRRVPGVLAVRCSCWMNYEDDAGEGVVSVGQGEGYRIEWFVEADFDNENGLSFGFDVACHRAEWIIGASARSHTFRGEAILVDLPTRYAIGAADLESELIGQVEMLNRHRDDAVQLFAHQA